MNTEILKLLLPHLARFIARLDIETQETLCKALRAVTSDFDVKEVLKTFRPERSDD